METARFLVSLIRSENRLCRVERNIRRKDQSRAVFHAQLWLLQTQRLEPYFGVTYDVYEIYEQNGSGEWVRVNIGGVSDAETGRTKARQAQQQKKETSVPSKSSGMAGRTKGKPKAGKARTSARTDSTFGYEVQQRDRKARSPLQQRIDLAKEVARQAVADKKARGEI